MHQKRIKDLLSKGKTIIEIAKIYGVHRSTIANWMKKWGISKNQLRLNHGFFSDIKTEKQAYWLGYIYADGSVVDSEKTIPRVDITSKDIDHLHIWHKDLESCNKITIIDPKKGCVYGRSMNRSQQMVDDLKELGCMPNKTFKLSFPKINNDLYRHFIRGYFDGDGSISLFPKQFAIHSGCYSFIVELKEVLPIKTNIYFRNNCYKIYRSKKSELSILHDYFYDKSNIYLRRKKVVWDNVIKI